MNRKIMAILLMLVVALALVGCDRFGGIRGSGQVAEEERDVGEFTGVNLAGFGTVDIEIADQEELLIEAEDNLIEFLRTEVRGGTLEIGLEGTRLMPTKPVKFHVMMKSLDRLTVSGSGTIEVPDVAAERLSANISGSGRVEIGDLEADLIDVEISGSGKVEIESGKADEQRIGISGSGNYLGEQLESNRAEVSIGGSGQATVRVGDELEANVSGSGDIKYFGNPSVDTSMSGSGKVTKAGD